MTTRSDPFEPLEEMFERMADQLRTAAGSWESSEQLDAWMPGTTSMNVDVLDADDEYIVTVDVPGFDREDLTVRVTDNVLYVDAEHTEEEIADHERFIRKERAMRTTSRTIKFPTPVAADAVEGHMDRGVLTIDVPKAEPLEEGRSIEIEGE